LVESGVNYEVVMAAEIDVLELKVPSSRISIGL